MNQTWNQHVVKKENKTLVLETIKTNTPISRARVAQLTGLNKGTVSSLVSELIDGNIIGESGPGESSGGRRPVMLLFNHLAGYSIAIDLGVNYILGLLTDLNGNIICEQRVHFKDKTFEHVMLRLFEIIEDLQQAAPESHYGVVGIGIGVPGVVSNDGELLLAPNLEWKRIHLLHVLEERFNLPIVIENEANAGAYGEKVFGVGQDFSNMVYCSIGTGIGVGLILEEKLFKGFNGFSGELGHMTIEKDGIPCRCGNKGCWERYASESALLEKALRLGLIEKNDVTPIQTLVALADNGLVEAIDLFAEIGEYIGVGLTNSINIFNPQAVIIGNQMAATEKWIRPALERYIKNHAIGFHQEDLKIKFSSLTSHSTAYGMAAFTIEAFSIRFNNTISN
ncbi:ROK family transcriptional regulator [Paraliobacillus sp. X-1268]|uniref:ROK family transcriptional regulator n=1 Tax=Paraliobacillus sp. X-1268 TaxID=2213193 RepID=UPI000E3D844B|nr:ROK family transcriptional regulator [Paraliobacillus sp. X-1268]